MKPVQGYFSPLPLTRDTSVYLYTSIVATLAQEQEYHSFELLLIISSMVVLGISTFYIVVISVQCKVPLENLYICLGFHREKKIIIFKYIILSDRPTHIFLDFARTTTNRLGIA